MENTKKKNRFNIIDAIVILLIAALVFGIIYFIMMETGALPGTEANKKTVVYTVRISGVDERYLDSFALGSEAINSSTFSSLGTITEVKSPKTVSNSTLATKTEDGKSYYLKQTEYEDKYDIYITLTATADVDERGIAYVGSQRITIGSCVYFRCGNFAAATYITDFSIA